MSRAVSLLTAVLLTQAATGAQVGPAAKFSAEDMIKVVSAAVQAVTDDGRLVAFSERRTYDNAETDNYRYGDPTCVAPTAARFVVVDIETGQRWLPLGERLVNVRQAEFSRGFSARAAFLGDHGYAFFTPSVNLVVGRPGESWAKGVTAAANKLIDMGVADPDKLGVEGTSYGGYATVLLLTQTDRFKAAVNVSGKVDLISFYTDSPRLGVRNTHAAEKSQDRISGTLWEFPERYLDHSAIMRADRITTPLLCLTGDQDPNVPDSQSREKPDRRP